MEHDLLPSTHELNCSNLVYSIYDEVSVLVHQAERLPLYYSRLQRAIAREVDMDDIDEAMDHFLDIFESAFNTRMGFREPVHDDIVEVRAIKLICCHISERKLVQQLETMTFATKHVCSEPDISNALVVLIKQACADIRSVRLAKWDEEDNFDFDAQEDSIFEIHQTVLKHAIKMSKFIVPKLIERAAYQAEQEGTEEVQEETMRIESEGVGTKPKESEWTSID